MNTNSSSAEKKRPAIGEDRFTAEELDLTPDDVGGDAFEFDEPDDAPWDWFDRIRLGLLVSLFVLGSIAALFGAHNGRFSFWAWDINPVPTGKSKSPRYRALLVKPSIEHRIFWLLSAALLLISGVGCFHQAHLWLPLCVLAIMLLASAEVAIWWMNADAVGPDGPQKTSASDGQSRLPNPSPVASSATPGHRIS